jgi:hypothetical protein
VVVTLVVAVAPLVAEAAVLDGNVVDYCLLALVVSLVLLFLLPSSLHFLNNIK